MHTYICVYIYIYKHLKFSVTIKNRLIHIFYWYIIIFQVKQIASVTINTDMRQML